MAGLAAGLVGIGTCNDEVTTTILQCLLEKSPVALKSPFTRFLVLGLALCYLGKNILVPHFLFVIGVSAFSLCEENAILKPFHPI